jgi:hypothetical protein
MNDFARRPAPRDRVNEMNDFARRRRRATA